MNSKRKRKQFKNVGDFTAQINIPRTLRFDFDISNCVATNQAPVIQFLNNWSHVRNEDKQTVGHETTTGFFRETFVVVSLLLF